MFMMHFAHTLFKPIQDLLQGSSFALMLSTFVPLQASHEGLIGRFAPSALHALCSHSWSLCSLRPRVLRSHSWSLRSLGLCTLCSHSRSLCSLAFCASRSRKFKKKIVSQSTQNGLKRIEMQKKFFYPFDSLRFARSAASDGAQPYLPLRLFHARILSRFAPSGFAIATYPMPLSGS